MRVSTFTLIAFALLTPAPTLIFAQFIESCDMASMSLSTEITGTYFSGFVASTWLNGTCDNANQVPTYSAIDLSLRVGNDNGYLMFKDNGSFTESCGSCTLALNATMCCNCENNRNAYIESCIDLDPEIGNNNGQMQFNI